MNLRTFHNQTGAVVLHSQPDAVKRAIKGSLRIRGEQVVRIEGTTALFPIPPLSSCWIVSKFSGLTRLEDIGSRMLSLSNEQFTALYGTPIVIPAATIAGQHEEFVTASLPMFAYANEDVSDAMVYQLVKSFWENRAALAER